MKDVDKMSDRELRNEVRELRQKSAVMIGQNIKVLLPGERPWVKVIEESGDRFKGKIVNTLFHELSEHEQARFMKRELGEVEPLPQLHSFKRGDEVWFEEGTGNERGWWIPVEDKL